MSDENSDDDRQSKLARWQKRNSEKARDSDLVKGGRMTRVLRS